MKLLIILSASAKIKGEPKEPIPAFERFNGVFFRILRKYLSDKFLKDTEIIIVSDKLGIITADQKVPYIQTTKSDWGILDIKSDSLNEIRSRNLEQLRELTSGKEYDEIYVNVGKQYLKLIEGFDAVIKNKKITFSEGAGLGHKASHMKNWMLGHST